MEFDFTGDEILARYNELLDQNPELAIPAYAFAAGFGIGIGVASKEYDVDRLKAWLNGYEDGFKDGQEEQ